MTGTEPLDREPAEYAGPHGDRLVYRDRLGVVSEARPMSRPALLAAVAAVCGTGLLAGLGLFGGSTPPKPRPPAPAAAVLKTAGTVAGGDSTAARVGEGAHQRPAHRVHTHHPATHVPHSLHAAHTPHPVHAPHPVSHSSTHETARRMHKGSAGSGAPHSAGRHSPLREAVRTPARPATARPAAPSATPRTAPRRPSAATGPAASR